MKLDSHQHFWSYSKSSADYGWITDPLKALKNDFLPHDLDPLLQRAGFTGTIAVQARETATETDFLLELADRNSFINGVVGWIDLCSADCERELEKHVSKGPLRGLRMVLQDNPDPDMAISNEHVFGVSRLERFSLTYDLLIKPENLSAAVALASRLPNQKFVVDHMAKPTVNGLLEPVWRRGIFELAQRPNVWCKLSGLVTQTAGISPRLTDFNPYLEYCVNAFTPERCMIGSDWPVCTLVSDYGTTVQIVEQWCKRLSVDEQRMILGKTCADFYNLLVS